MLRNLSQREQETLVMLGTSGPAGNFDVICLNKLFTLGLVEIDRDRRVVLTKEGRELSRKIARDPPNS